MKLFKVTFRNAALGNTSTIYHAAPSFQELVDSLKGELVEGVELVDDYVAIVRSSK